jgi:hypothetical protein
MCGARLANAIYPANRLSFHRWIERRLHQHHMLRFSQVQPV